MKPVEFVGEINKGNKDVGKPELSTPVTESHGQGTGGETLTGLVPKVEQERMETRLSWCSRAQQVMGRLGGWTGMRSVPTLTQGVLVRDLTPLLGTIFLPFHIPMRSRAIWPRKSK